ncbi:hypothetical protein DOX48_21115 [Cronobacter malonaticus]|nr:hypothetical protein [Cronobacter malonaticus]
MNASLIIAFLPVLFSFFSLWVNFIHGNNKNKTAIIDSLSKELSSKKPTAYIIQACVSRIHNSRPIPYKVLKDIVYYNNALEIIQLFSTGRKLLDILKLTEKNNRIIVGYSATYEKSKSRIITMIICSLLIAFCYSLSVNLMVDIMLSFDTIKYLSSVALSDAGDLLLQALGLAFFMFMMFVFSLQLLIIWTSKKRIIKIQALIDDNNFSHNRYRNRNSV